jgi:hypothetical protein
MHLRRAAVGAITAEQAAVLSKPPLSISSTRSWTAALTKDEQMQRSRFGETIPTTRKSTGMQR